MAGRRRYSRRGIYKRKRGLVPMKIPRAPKYNGDYYLRV